MEFVTFEVQDNIGIVTVNRPPVNAINGQMYKEIAALFKSINGMDDVRAVVLRAEGKQFMAGNDLTELKALTKSTIMDYRDIVKSSVGSVYDCKVPVIAAVNGAALGAGFCYAATSDLIVASEKAIFGIPEAKIGFISAAGFASLLVPLKVVNYMAMTGNPLKADEIAQYGGIFKVVPPEQLMDTAMDVAKMFLANSPLVVKGWKRALHINMNPRLSDQYDVEFALSEDLLDTHDYEEALTAFLEKRKPVYTGK